MPEFFWTKTNGKLTLPAHCQQERQMFLDSLREGQTVKETLVRVQALTTHQQIKAFFGMIVSVTMEELHDRGYEVMGVPLTKDQTKQVIYQFCAPKDGLGKSITLSNHPESSIENTMTLFENSCRWLAETFGRVVPPPDPAWKEHQTVAAPAEPSGSSPSSSDPVEPPVFPCVCTECGKQYKVIPAGGRCLSTHYGVSCSGKVVLKGQG